MQLHSRKARLPQLVVLLLGLTCTVAHGQARLNLSFESTVNRPNPLVFWSWNKNPAAHVTLDTTTAARQGRGSVRFELDADEPAASIFFTNDELPIDSVRGNLTVRAWLRTAGFQGTAGLYARVYGTTSGETLVRVDSSSRRRPANSEWQLLEMQLPVPAAAAKVLLGFQAQGTGRVWLDAVELRVASHRYLDSPLPGTEPFLLPVAAPNWDFERPLVASLPAPVFAPDSGSPARGRRSLHLTLPAGSPSARLHLGSLPIAAASQGKTLTVSGYIRQLAPGPAPALTSALLGEPLRPGGTRSTVGLRSVRAYQEVPLAPPPGPAWQPFRLAVPLPPLVNDDFRLTLSLGIRLGGAAPVELDDLSFAVDGQPYAPAPATVAAAPTAAEVGWLRQHLLPVPLADLTPLAALRPVFASARVVGLGQVTTSSLELAQLKFRLFRLLAEQQGFTYLVLDADVAAALALDSYVQGGPGVAPTLLAALGPDWNAPPLLALVQWLRTYNQRPGVAHLHVAGLRPQQPLAAVAALRQEPVCQAPAAQELLQRAEQAMAALGQAVQAHAPADELLPPATKAAGLAQELATYLDVVAKIKGRPVSPVAPTAASQLVRLLTQYATAYALPGQQRLLYQTGALAENVYALSQQHPTAKLAVWGHNELVALTDEYDRPLGEWLRATFGASYVALGITFAQGTYRAGSRGLVTAQAPYPSTVEAWLHATGLLAGLLPLRPVALHDETAWLFQKQLFRDIRQSSPAQDFHLHQPHLEFDALLFVNEIKE
jgi:erythromycin esterase